LGNACVPASFSRRSRMSATKSRRSQRLKPAGTRTFHKPFLQAMSPNDKAGRTHSHLPTPPPPAGKNWLLVVAIDAYQHCARLRNCVHDAQKIIGVLQKKYQFDHVLELYNEAATKTNIVAQLNQLSEKINKDVDNLVLYFSGHGETEGEDDGDDEQIGYLIPVEAQRGDESQYIPHLFLRSKLNRIRTWHTFVIIDACFAGSFFYNVRSEKRSGSEQLPSRWGISSSNSHEVALDGAPGDHSPFATCLLAALEANTAPLGIHGLAAEVENRMQAQHARQTPICLPFSDPNRYSGQFYFHPQQSETDAWAQAQRADSIAGYEIFLRSFPNGVHAPQARQRLAQLEDDRFWQDVQQKNTEAAFLSYYERGRDERHRQESYRKLQQLEEEKSWRNATLRDSMLAYLEYLQKHPNGTHAPDARDRIAALRILDVPVAEPIVVKPDTSSTIRLDKPLATNGLVSPKIPKPRPAFPWRRAGIAAGVLLVIAFIIWQFSGINEPPAVEPEKTTQETKPIEPEMVLVKGGTFQMGSNDGGDDEKPVHPVTVSDFSIGKTEVTVKEYLAFAHATNSHYPEWMKKGSEYNIKTGSDDHYKKLGDALTNENHPIVGVSWEDAVAYCKWLSEKTGQNYRLPTEAEWEYAARGGANNSNDKYLGNNAVNEVARYDGKVVRKTHPVGQKKSNELGLYDMNGNVLEWCSDWYSDYTAAAQHNPTGPAKGSYRVIRGGNWCYDPRYCRSDLRGAFTPPIHFYFVGFRLARY